jgi:hypothetical protein
MKENNKELSRNNEFLQPEWYILPLWMGCCYCCTLFQDLW